jgi:hypothetical protein
VPQVQTVRGPVDTAELGRTLVHEHVFVLSADVQQNSTGLSRRRALAAAGTPGLRGSADRRDLAGAGRHRGPGVGVWAAGVGDPRAGRRGAIGRPGGGLRPRAQAHDQGEQHEQSDKDTADDQERREHVQNVRVGTVRVIRAGRADLTEDAAAVAHTSPLDGAWRSIHLGR